MLLAILLIAFALVTYFKPTFALGLILALLPTYLFRFQLQGLPTTFLELILISFLIITFAKNFNKLSELKSLGHLNWLILVFVLAGIISTLISPDKRSALGILKAFIIEPVLLFYAIKLVVRRVEDLTTPLNLLFLSAVVISLFGIFQYLTFMYLPLQFWGTGEEVTRIVSVFEYPNALALYLAPLIAFFLAGLMFGEKILNRKNLILGLIFMIGALILTFSRGAWIALAFTFFILLIQKYPLKKVLASALILIILLFAIPSTRHRLGLISKDPSSSAHLDLMSAAWTKIQENPIFGNGLSGFRTTLTNQSFLGEILNYPHNIFLNFWLDMGIMGLISFFGIIFLSGQRYKINRSWYTSAAIAYLLTMIVHGLVDVPYFKNDLAILFWFILSIFFI